MDYLHDFRKGIVLKKRDKKYWSNWNDWNILYKTLAYELSWSCDVERYCYVKKQVLEYFPDYKKYICGTTELTLDIMNGWWFCFKELFGLKSRKSRETLEYLESLNKQIKHITQKEELIRFINTEYKIEEKYTKALLEFLEVVYTIGNITQVSENRHADCFDSWEYKLFKSDWMKYKKESDYMEYFVFNDYCEKWWDELKKCDDMKNKLLEYMNSRIYLIKERGKKIITREDRS